MIRYVVLKDRRGKTDYCVVKVNVDEQEFKTKNELVEITFFNGKSRLIKKEWVYKTRAEAIRVSKERTIIKHFKEKYKRKNDEWVCSSCGRHVGKELVTVDHIRPIHSFKKKGKYITPTHWEICWRVDNLTLMCIDCNSNKSSMNIKKHLRLNKKSTFHKLNIFKRKNQKIKKCSIELARRDSRILDKNTILLKKPTILQTIRGEKSDIQQRE